jgi:hypothetical protein
MTSPSSPRKQVDLSQPVQRHLSMYVIAAGAAGVGMLALSQPAQGKIMYTPAHVKNPDEFTFEVQQRVQRIPRWGF